MVGNSRDTDGKRVCLGGGDFLFQLVGSVAAEDKLVPLGHWTLSFVATVDTSPSKKKKETGLGAKTRYCIFHD